MEYIFISHALVDHEIVAKLAAQLKNAGYKTWQDEEVDSLGAELGQQTIFAIERSDAFLLALSAQSFESERVVRQLEVAERSQRPILIANMEQAEPPSELNQEIAGRPVFDLSQNFDEGFNRLVDHLEGGNVDATPTEAEAGTLGGDPYPEIPMMSREEILWSEQGYYWYKKWGNLVRVETVLTNKRLIFFWDSRDAWKWKKREWDELTEEFPISVLLSEITEVGAVQKPKALLIFATSAPYAEITTNNDKSHKITLSQNFDEKLEILRELIS